MNGLSFNGQDDLVALVSAWRPYEGGGLYAFDGERVWQVDAISSNGLTYRDGRLARGLRSLVLPGSVGEVVVYGRDGFEAYHRLDEVQQPHDLRFAGEELIAVSTSQNALVWIAPNGEVTRVVRLGERAAGDAWHLNCLDTTDGRLVCTAFGFFERHGAWRGRQAGNGVLYDVEHGRLIASGFTAPHTPRLVDGEWLVCNSGERTLVSVDERRGRILRQVEVGNWPRGLAVTDEHFLVGTSAKRDSFADASGTWGSPFAELVVVSRDRWEVDARYRLEPQLEIYDVCLVPRSMVDVIAAAADSLTGLLEQVGEQPPIEWQVSEELDRDSCAAVMTLASHRLEVPEHRLLEVPVRIQHQGQGVWCSRPPYPVNLAFRIYDEQGALVYEGPHGELPGVVRPGDEVEAMLALVTPAAGRYLLEVDLVAEGRWWFSQVGPSGARAVLEVLPDDHHRVAAPEAVADRNSEKTREPPYAKQAMSHGITVNGQDGYRLFVSTHASPHGDPDPAGLFCYDGREIRHLDPLSTNGLAAIGDAPAGEAHRLATRGFARVLYSHVDEIRDNPLAPGTIGEVLIYDQRALKRYVRLDEVREPHDILWDGEHLLVVSTATTSVLWLDPAGDVVRTWSPFEQPVGDAWHLNSLEVHEGRVYTTAFGRFKEHSAWKGNEHGNGVLIEVPSGRVIAEGLSGPHSPRFVDDSWLVCDSHTNRVVRLHPGRGQVVQEVDLGQWTRGMAVADDYVFVGLSGPPRIAVLDRWSLQVEELVDLPAGSVYELMLADAQMEASVYHGWVGVNAQRRVDARHYREFSPQPPDGVDELPSASPSTSAPDQEPQEPARKVITFNLNLPPSLTSDLQDTLNGA